MKKLLSISAVSLLLFASSCKKVLEDVNVNPNSPTDAPSNLILNGAQVSSIVLYEGDWARLGGMWSQSFTGQDRQYISLNGYTTTAGDYDNTWSTAYRGVIAPCKIIIEKETATNNKLMIGIAQVMEAQAFGTLTALFGDIPFSEACDASIATPKFDKQVDVYAGVQTLLDDAITNLSSGVGVSPGAKDIFYGGARASWIAAAHTLKARFYMHTKNYAAAATEAASGITDASDNMMAPHGAAYNSDFNLYYSFCVYDRDSYMWADEAVAPRLLDPSAAEYRGNAKTNEEARFNYVYLPGGSLGYSAVYELNALCDFDWGNATEENGFFGGSTSFPLVTYAENQLILAEAAMRSGSFDGALTALNDYRAYLAGGGYIGAGYVAGYGIQYDAYVDADFEAGGMDNGGAATKEEALLKEIIEERYVTLVGQLEQFNDVRRTKNAIGLTPVSGSSIPQRFFYPQSEINTNTNTPSQTSSDLYVATAVNQ